MQQLRKGDEQAAFVIFERYSRRLAGLARLHLQGILANKVETEDVLQSVFRSFFLRNRQGQFQLDSWDSLWSLLTVITLRKCRKQYVYFSAACRNVGREQHQGFCDETSEQACLTIAREPSPDESAALVELIEQLLASQSTRDRQIVELALQGFVPSEIGEQVKCSQRTTERVLKRVRSYLEDMIDQS